MKPRKSYTSLFNLFYIIVCIIWPPFQLYILHADGAGRTIIFLSVLAVLLNWKALGKRKRVFATPAFRCWVVLLCYSMLNAFVKGFYAENGTFGFLKVNFFHPILFLVIAMLELHKDRRTGLKVIWVALGIYLLIGLPSLVVNRDDRLMVEGLGNLYPLHAVAFLFVSAVLLVEGRIKMWVFVGLTIAVSAVILMSGTRKAFGAEFIILLGVVLNYGKKKNLWAWIRIILLGGVLLAGVRFAMNHSTVGQRFAEGEEKNYNVQLVGNQHVNDVLMTILGDRAIQYEIGLELFSQHFLTGIGLTNFMNMSRTEFRLHSEYMVQLCENGIIGFVLLILFYVYTISALQKSKKRMKSKVINMVLFGLLAILFLNLTAWTYCQNYVMIVYAMALTYAYSKPKYKYSLQRKKQRMKHQQRKRRVSKL